MSEQVTSMMTVLADRQGNSMNAISRKVIARAGWLLSSALALGIAWPSTALAAVQQTIWIPIGELPFVWVPVHKSPSLTWTGVPGASGYDVQVEADGRVYQQHFDSPGAATLASFGLTPVPGSSYRFRVRAVSNISGGGAWSPWMDDDGSFSPAAVVSGGVTKELLDFDLQGRPRQVKVTVQKNMLPPPSVTIEFR